MAFTTSAVRLGVLGDRWVLTGKYSSSAGDTTGTVSVGGALVHHADFTNQDSDPGENSTLEHSVSTNTSTGLSTITVSLSSSVITNGRFLIIYN